MRNCTRRCMKGLFGLFLLFNNLSYAQTTLSAGDIVFTGYDATPNVATGDIYSFVLLTNISSGTTIHFTDRGYMNPGWVASGSTEGTVRWTSGSALPMGTEIIITGNTARVASTGLPNGTISTTEGTLSNGLNLTPGDQVIAFQNSDGLVTNASTSFIAGINFFYCNANTSTAAWNTGGCTIGVTASLMPPGLVGGTSAFYPGSVGSLTASSGKFNCTGTPAANAAAIRAAVMNQSNWTITNASPSTLTMPSGCTFIGVSPSITTQPLNRTVCVTGTTTFGVTATGAVSYQWQENTGGSYSNISNGGVYSNATTATLTLTGVTQVMSGNQYRVVVTGTGSVTSNAATLVVSNPTVINASQTNIACNGLSNGSASVTLTGGVTPYTYSWSPSGGTAATATGLSAGSYTVSVIDNIGCAISRNFIITQPPALTTVGSQTNIACNGGSNGSATVTPSGGTGSYTYSWTPFGGTAATASGLPTGSYTVNVGDANGCTASRTFTITQPPALGSSASSSPTCLNGNSGSATVSATGGTPGYTYSWSPSGGTAATAQNLSAGNYNATITDANGCTRTQPVAITSTSPSQQGGVAGTSGSSSTQTQPAGAASGNYTDGNCNRITTVTPSGANPVNGPVTTKVWVETAVPTHGNAPYVARHYEITPANNPSTATGTVTLYYLQSEFNAFNAAPNSVRKLPTGPSDATGIANLRVGKYSGTSSDNSGRPASYGGSALIINPADNDIVWNATEGRWEVSFAVSGFSGFVLQTNPSLLPASLTAFSATKTEGKAILQWKTATEQNTSRFEVERSGDGKTFSRLDVVQAAGSSTTTKTYGYTDGQPLAMNYYRLRMIDRNEAATYSAVAVVKMGGRQGLDVFPNPARQSLRVQLAGNSETAVEIYDATGHRVKLIQVPAGHTGSFTLNVTALSQGTYYLKAGGETVRFVKD